MQRQQQRQNSTSSVGRQQMSTALDLLMFQQNQQDDPSSQQASSGNPRDVVHSAAATSALNPAAAPLLMQQYSSSSAQQQNNPMLSHQNLQQQHQQQQMLANLTLLAGSVPSSTGVSASSMHPSLGNTSLSLGNDKTSLPNMTPSSMTTMQPAAQHLLGGLSNGINSTTTMHSSSQPQFDAFHHLSPHQQRQAMDHSSSLGGGLEPSSASLAKTPAHQLVALLQNTKPLHVQRQEYAESIHKQQQSQQQRETENNRTLHQTTIGTEQQNPSSSSMFLLHQACRLYASTPAVIDCALKADPSSALRKCHSSKNKRGYTHEYVYPINIAIQNKASLQVLQLLAHAAPEALVQPDGPEACCSLAIATSTLDHEASLVAVLELFLHVNPRCASTKDSKRNYPLHYACSKRLSVDIVKRIAESWPQALYAQNFHGQVPLDIAQQSGNILPSCDDVVNYLQELCFDALEHRACHLDDDDDESLDDLDHNFVPKH